MDTHSQYAVLNASELFNFVGSREMIKQHLQKLRKCDTTYLSLRSVYPNFTSKGGRGQTNFFPSFAFCV
jgi:hypothetical protein